MAIWVGKQKMACRSCIKGHRSSTCNHIGGPLWAVRPAGRPNKACIHGPGDLCLCAHYFPLTWLKAAVPRNKKCSCQGHGGSGGRKCSCGVSNSAANGAANSSPIEDDTQPIFYQELVARGLQVTTEPIDLDVPAAAPPPANSRSCCSAPAPAPAPVVGGSCCSGPGKSGSAMPTPISVPIAEPAQSSCCSTKTPKSEAVTPTTNGHIKSEPISTPTPFTPIPQFAAAPLPHSFPVMKFPPAHNGKAASAADHVCECGPTCNCVLCIDHPYNTATMHHIATEFGQMMNTGAPQQFSPTASNGGGSGAMNDIFWGNNGMMPPGFTDTSFWGQYAQQQQQQQQHQSHSPPQQATDMDIILNPADFQMFNFAFPPLDERENGASNGHGAQHHEQFDVSMGGTNGSMEPMTDLLDLDGFCGGAHDGCPCGDDCACIGCQIHKPAEVNGHENGNGITNGVGPPRWA